MTNLLYPRLPPAVARQLFDQRRNLSPKELVGEARLTHPDAVYAALGGTQVPDHYLGELGRLIRTAASKAGYPDDRGTGPLREQFDRECAEVLHRDMKAVAAEAASIDVWAFMGVVLLPDVCLWRFPKPPEDRVIGPDLTRHTFARLWWRAYQLADLEAGGGLSALNSISESEMNQIFERRTIGGDTTLVRAVARVLVQPDAAWADVPKRLLVRDGTSRIRRLLAFALLSGLEPYELAAVLHDIFSEAALAIRHTRDSTSAPEGIGPEARVNNDDSDNSVAASFHQGAPEQVVNFDGVRLGEVPAQIAELVNGLGGLPDADLITSYQQRFGVSVKTEDHALLRRFAWSAKGRHFLELDEQNSLWLPGTGAPTRIMELGDWTIAGIRARAQEMLRDMPSSDPFERLLSEVYNANGRRVPRLVMSLVGRILNEVRRKTK